MTEKLQNKLNKGREYRNMLLEVRKAEKDAFGESEKKYIVEGYATTFDQAYTLWDYGTERVDEVIDRNAFSDCDMSDVIFQYNHEGRVFARISNDTLKLDIDEHGLKVVADLGGTEEGRKLFEEIEGGYTNKMSFGFIVAEDKVMESKEESATVYTRTITRISKLFDVSAVSIPANDATEISSRSYSDGVYQRAIAERQKKAEMKAKLKLKAKLMMEV